MATRANGTGTRLDAEQRDTYTTCVTCAYIRMERERESRRATPVGGVEEEDAGVNAAEGDASKTDADV